MHLTIGPDHLSTTIDFTVPETDQVGILLSAGLDSSALLCMIIQELKDTGRIDKVTITAFTVVKPTHEPVYAEIMLKAITDHYGVSIQHENYLPNTEPFLSSGTLNPPDHINSIYEKYGRNIAIYMAVNNMPPESVKKFNGSLGFVYNTPTDHYRPFLNLYKPQMISIFYKLGVEFLIPYAHSCAKQAIGKCKKCYSCEERAWGFEQLGLPDPATIDILS